MKKAGLFGKELDYLGTASLNQKTFKKANNSKNTMIRSPICTVAGHVDHGKSSILDFIRKSNIVSKEAGAITQAIGASIVPLDIIKKICGDLLKSLNLEFTIPGLLFLDTPGHAAFSNIRKRGGNLADIAILVIDINEGIKPQTEEVLQIFKQYKTPFIIAANKIDLLSGWKSENKPLISVINGLPDNVKYLLDEKVYEIVGKLSEMGIQADRFDRVDDYTKQIAIIPTSAKKGDGIPELLMVLAGLAQKYLEKSLETNAEGEAKGTVIEVKEEKGLGTTLDVVLYDGTLKVNDTIVIGGLNGAVVTKVKSLLEPSALAEMRDKKTKFRPVKEVKAAIGVKIAAQEIEDVVAGMPLVSAKDVEKAKEEVQKAVEEVIIETDTQGIIVKADSLGSLEALVKLLKDKDVAIKKASIGNISKKDLIDADANNEKNPMNAIVLGFNVADISGVCMDNVKVVTNDVIYKLIEDFEKWQEERKKELECKELDDCVKPCKIELLKGYVFRQSNPAVVGIHVVEGTLFSGTPLMNSDGKLITEVKGIQADQESVEKAEKNKQVAVSLPGVMVGRQIKEGDILYSAISEEQFRKYKQFKEQVSKEDIALLKEIAELMRKNNSMWGI